MARPAPPPLPPDAPASFRSTVHGTVFGERSVHVASVQEGDELILLPGPPLEPEPGVWVHLRNGDLVGHLPPEIERWMSPWMLRGGSARARAVRVCGQEVPSWRRLVIEVTCTTPPD